MHIQHVCTILFLPLSLSLSLPISQLSRGGVLEPEGTVEIKFRQKDKVKMMARLDKPYATILEKLRSPELTTAEQQQLEEQQKAREELLSPMYHQVGVACTTRWVWHVLIGGCGMWWVSYTVYLDSTWCVLFVMFLMHMCDVPRLDLQVRCMCVCGITDNVQTHSTACLWWQFLTTWKKKKIQEWRNGTIR